MSNIKACFLILAAPNKVFDDSRSLGDTKESKSSSVQWMIQFIRARLEKFCYVPQRMDPSLFI